jgi:putative heme-binding domain-containing protein
MELVRLGTAGRLSTRGHAAAALAIRECPDLSVRALALEAFPDARREGRRPEVDEVLAEAGERRRGQELFFGPRASCSSCHAFAGRGGEVGPGLSGIASKYAARETAEAILFPSRAIAFGYDAWTVETDDGLVHTGFLLADGADVVLRDTAGHRHVLPSAEVVARTRQKLSTMPDDIALGLQASEVADLVAFLRSDPLRPGRRGTPRELFDGRSLAGWRFHSETPGAHEGVWTVADGVLRCAGMPIGYLATEERFESFELELEWRFDPAKGAGNSGVLLRVGPDDEVWPRSIEAQLQHREAGDVWNIGSFPLEIDPARTEGRRTRKLAPSSERPLGGWNRYRIVLDGGELTLEVNGVLQNRASWCEERPGRIALQSEGAAIEFRAVRLTPIERD